MWCQDHTVTLAPQFTDHVSRPYTGTMFALPRGVNKTTKEEINKLVKDYADSDRSDTFVSYNDAIVLAQEIRRLRRRLARAKRAAK